MSALGAGETRTLERETARKVAFLSRRAAYPGEAGRGEVEVVETRASFVFLCGERVWKLKKPVCRPPLDLSTLERRRWNAEEELRLNRRLAPEVYLGLEPLVERADGGLALGGAGRVVDWLVVMRRLPAARTLERTILAGRVSDADLVRLGELLADFHGRAAPAEVTPEEHHARLVEGVQEDLRLLLRAELESPRAAACGGAGFEGVGLGGAGFRGMGRAAAERLGTELLAALAAGRRRFQARVEAGRVIEGHGDLRPEHVYLVRPRPLVIDCLEFSRPLRELDPADELAYLGLECERLGAPGVGARVLEVYRAARQGDPPAWLVAFYRRYRALRRARLALSHLEDADPRDPQRWRARCAEYLALAGR